MYFNIVTSASLPFKCKKKKILNYLCTCKYIYLQPLFQAFLVNVIICFLLLFLFLVSSSSSSSFSSSSSSSSSYSSSSSFFFSSSFSSNENNNRSVQTYLEKRTESCYRFNIWMKKESGLINNKQISMLCFKCCYSSISFQRDPEVNVVTWSSFHNHFKLLYLHLNVELINNNKDWKKTEFYL